MDVKTGFFYLFSLVLLFAAFRVITARNPVHAVLFLMLSFSQASAIWLLLKAEFLAITLVLVYLGAVMVLFLFVVMMLDIKIDALRQGFWRHFPLAAMLGAIVVLEMAAVLMAGFRLSEEPRVTQVILLVAMIAAIALTLRARKDTKTIDPSEQVRVRAGDRLHIVKLDPTRPAPVAEAAPEENKA